MRPVRVLYFLNGGMGYGGTEAFIMNYYRHFDHNNIVIDFVIQGNDVGVYGQELEKYGSLIYYVPYKNRNPLEYSRKVKMIIQDGNYKIVHSMMDAMGAWPLSIAKSVGVPVRISHSHNTNHQTRSKVKKAWNDIAKRILIKAANVYWACGEDAGRWLFGNKLFDNKKVRVVHDAIDVNKYRFSEDDRKDIRDEFHLSDNAIVIGHVGQFREQKNHHFLLEVFRAVKNSQKNVVLMMVGDGKLQNLIEEQANDLKIDNSVIFTGARDDVDKIMSAFDLFLFPSLFEGLSIVAIEAQCNGLPCIFSGNIPDEAIITNTVKKLDLTLTSEEWAREVCLELNAPRMSMSECIKDAGFDISIEAQRLENEYLRLYKGAISGERI